MKRITWLLLAALTTAITLSACHSAEDSVLLQVGTCDNSYAEFGIAGRHEQYQERFGGGGVFEVGKGDPAKNWCYVQPGPDDKWAGDGEHPFEVIFDLDEAPKGPLVLTVDLAGVNPGPTTMLRTRLNDMDKLHDLKPGESEAALADPGANEEQIVKRFIPAGFLRKGRNVLNLTVMKGSWILYDCVSLARVDSVPVALDDLSLQSTFLFKKRGGELKQIAQSRFDLYEDQPIIRASIVGESGWRAEQEFSNVPSGRCKLDIEIPPAKAREKTKLSLNVAGAAFEAETTIEPEKQWKIYMAPSAHFDHGYSDLQHKALKVHFDNLDTAMDYVKRFPGFRWNLEGSFIAEEYLRFGSRPDEFLKMAKQGDIGVSALYTNHLTGLCDGEELSRILDYYDFLRRQYGFESKYVMFSDIPTMTWTLPMALAGHGVKYLSHGTNPVRAKDNRIPELYPCYWVAPDGSKVLIWRISGQYAQSAEITGLDDAGHMGLAMDRVGDLVRRYKEQGDGYPFDAVFLHSGYGDNWPIGISLAEVPDEWNRTYEYPKLIFCRGSEFFEYIEANFAQHIKTVKGDGGPWWEDGAGSSARETGITRVAKSKLNTAEKLISISGRALSDRMAPELAAAWKQVLLFDEHTWGAADSIFSPFSKMTLGQWEIKKSFADRAAEMSRNVLAKAWAGFRASVKPAKDSVVVFNPSGWTRSGYVAFTAPDGKERSVFAESVPAMGYKLLAPSMAVAAPSPLGEGRTRAGLPVLENRFYRVTFDEKRGCVSSIYDRELKRELVDPSSYGVNAYLYVTSNGNDTTTREIGPDFDIQPAKGVSLVKSALPGQQVMTITCEAPCLNKPIKSRVVLHDDTKRIDFINELDKKQNLNKEAGYFAFPFAFDRPEIRVEIPDGVVRAEVDQLPGASRDWYCVQQFVTVSDGSAAVTWTPIDSPLATLQDINRELYRDSLDIVNGHVFGYAFNNYWWTNYKAEQQGSMKFAFSITSAKQISDVQARRFTEWAHTPMLAAYVPSGKGRAAREHSFVKVNAPNVTLQAVRPARFVDGTIVRLREMSGKNTDAKLSIGKINFRWAYLCNLAEDKLQPLEALNGVLTVPCRPLGLATVLLER